MKNKAITRVNDEVITEHYELNRNRLVKAAWRACGDGAEDVVQNAYERAIRYKSSFSGGDFNKWFNIIFRNCVRDYLQEQLGRSENDELDEYNHVGSYCPGFTNKCWKEIRKMIRGKNPNASEVLNLYFNKAYSYKDIASVTDNTYFNCYRIVSRFKDELRTKFS